RCRPCDRLIDEPLSTRFLRRYQSKQLIYPPYHAGYDSRLAKLNATLLTLILRCRLKLPLLVDIDQQRTQIPTASSLSSFEQRLGTRIDDLSGGFIVVLFDVALAKNPELLMCFVI